MNSCRITTVLVAIALILAGCGAKENKEATSTSSSAVTSTVTPTPKASDEDQIRDVLTREGAAFSVWDFDKVAELTCAKFRDQARSTDGAVPPMSTFPSADAAAMGADAFAKQIRSQFVGATDKSSLAVADAVIRQDENAYKAAMLDVVKQSMFVQLVQVDNIEVKGDTATADATVTQRLGDRSPDTRTTPATLVRENGQWLDCTRPDKP
jgi:sRNA-binding protein